MRGRVRRLDGESYSLILANRHHQAAGVGAVQTLVVCTRRRARSRSAVFWRPLFVKQANRNPWVSGVGAVQMLDVFMRHHAGSRSSVSRYSLIQANRHTWAADAGAVQLLAVFMRCHVWSRSAFSWWPLFVNKSK